MEPGLKTGLRKLRNRRKFNKLEGEVVKVVDSGYRQPTTFTTIQFTGRFSNNIQVSDYLRRFRSANVTLPLELNSVSIIQNGFQISLDEENSNYNIYPNKSFQQMVDDGDISVKWFMDGVEVVGETNVSLALDQNNGDQGKNVHSEVINNVDASVVTSNTITVVEVVWTPSQLTSLNLWLDASDESTITKDVNNNVSGWVDLSPNAYSANVLNGDITFENSPNCISFNGTGYYETQSIFSTSSLPSMLLCTVMLTNSALELARYGFGSYRNNFNVPHFNPAGDSSIRFDNGSAGGSISINSNNYFIRITKLSGNIIIDRINGVENINADSGRTFNHNKLSLGEVRSSSYVTKFSEVVVTENINQESIEKIEGYLAHKWNMTDKLPTNHPYKTTAP